MADIGMGTLYDLNKAAMENEPVMKKELLEQKKEELIQYFYEKPNNYFLLLCNEEKYYTVFHFTSKFESYNKTAAQDVIECMQNYGNLLSIEKTEDGVAMEIWARNFDTKEIHCFYLFPYDNGVIEY